MSIYSITSRVAGRSLFLSSPPRRSSAVPVSILRLLACLSCIVHRSSYDLQILNHLALFSESESAWRGAQLCPRFLDVRRTFPNIDVLAFVLVPRQHEIVAISDGGPGQRKISDTGKHEAQERTAHGERERLEMTGPGVCIDMEGRVWRAQSVH